MFYKLTRYEYWPWWIFYLPLLPHLVRLSFQTRSLSFFSAVNPAIPLGGFVGESKSAILEKIEGKYLPKTLLIPASAPIKGLAEELKKSNIQFPLIAKPDSGLRGRGVQKISSPELLVDYLNKIRSPIIIQEYIDYPIELGILYSRLPSERRGKITSVTGKEFLSVKGDGRSTVEQLMQQNIRASFQVPRLKKEMPEMLQTILPEEKHLTLEPIGNHCRGTQFINRNDLINEKLEEVFDEICRPIDGFCYGRFDLKVSSIEALYKGEGIKIMELNGAVSEPGHVYDTSYTLKKAYKDVKEHWSRMAAIAAENMRDGVKPAGGKAMLSAYMKNRG